LQAQFQNGAFLLVQAVKQLLDCFAQHGGFERRRLAAERVQPRRRIIPSLQRDLTGCVPALGAMIRSSFSALAHRDQREQAPETVPINNVQLPSTVAQKKALVCRLDYVFGFHFVPQTGADMPMGQTDELVSEALKEFLGRAVVLALQPGQEIRKGV